jgi:[ribosomal protein S5]-alanine N-acetyltransferase
VDWTQARRYRTDRLDLVAWTLEHLLAELESPDRLAAMLGAQIGPDWPPGEYDRGAQEFFRDRLIEGGEQAAGWYGWYAILRAAGDHPAVVVAAGGYFGPPTETGDVEIGFSVVRSFRRQGYAGEIVHALVSMALADPRVRRVVARTTPLNHASVATLMREGFLQAGSADNEGNIRFEKARPATQA